MLRKKRHDKKLCIFRFDTFFFGARPPRVTRKKYGVVIASCLRAHACAKRRWGGIVFSDEKNAAGNTYICAYICRCRPQVASCMRESDLKPHKKRKGREAKKNWFSLMLQVQSSLSVVHSRLSAAKFSSPRFRNSLCVLRS